jgi:hypothetical protein
MSVLDPLAQSTAPVIFGLSTIVMHVNAKMNEAFGLTRR